jgi:ATP-dependent DNA ligase
MRERGKSTGINRFWEHGRELFEAAQRLDFVGIVAKRKADLYSPQTVWYKVKNPAYTQAEGRGDLFHKPL